MTHKIMNLTGQGINNTYIVKSLVEETEFLQRWETSTVFSPNTFYLDLVKSEKLSQKIFNRSEEISKKLMTLQDIRNHSLLRTIEFGSYKNCFFTIQQKITGTDLQGIFNDNKKLSKKVILKIMNDLSSCLLAFEKRGLSHNLLSFRSVWFPENFDALGSAFISDTLLFCLMSFSNVDIESHFKEFDPCISLGSNSGNKYDSNIKNDLYSFGFIFYYLITGGKTFQNKEEIDFSLIEDDSVKKIIIQILGKDMKFQSALELRESFLLVFEKELYVKQTYIERDYSSSEATMYSTNLKNISYEGSKKTDSESVAEEIELIELFEEESVQKRNPSEFAQKMVNTVFGFFSRFRRSGRKAGSTNKSTPSGSNTVSMDQSEYTNSTISPTGDMQHKNDNLSGTRLKKLFRDLSSHYAKNDKKIRISRTEKNLDFNRRDSSLTNQVDNHEEIINLSGNREYTKNTGKRDFIIDDYTRIENKRTDFLLDDSMNRNHDFTTVSTTPVSDSENGKQKNSETPRKTVADFDSQNNKMEINKPEEIVQSDNESDSGSERKSELSSEKDDQLNQVESERFITEKPSLWKRFLIFIKKLFKFSH